MIIYKIIVFIILIIIVLILDIIIRFLSFLNKNIICDPEIGSSWSQDLACLKKFGGIYERPLDPAKYYTETTFLDYRFHEYIAGSRGMHTVYTNPDYKKDPPYRIGNFEQVLHVARHVPKNGKVLEVAFGKGANSIALAEFFPDCRVDGIDITPVHVEYAKNDSKRMETTNARFFYADVTNPSTYPKELVDEGYDVIFCLESLCYMDTADKRKKFAEFVKKYAKQGAKLIITDVYRGNVSYPELHRVFKHGWAIDELPSVAEWKNIFGETDFLDLKPRCMMYWANITKKMRTFSKNPLACLLMRLPFLKDIRNHMYVCVATYHGYKLGVYDYGLLVFDL